ARAPREAHQVATDVQDREGGARGEDGHSELDQFRTTEMHPRLRSIRVDVDRRCGVLGVWSPHPCPVTVRPYLGLRSVWSGETRAAVSAFLGRAVDRDLAQRAAVLPGFRVLHHLRPDQPRGPLTTVRKIFGQDSLHRSDVEPLAAPGLDLMLVLLAEQILRPDR